MKTYTMKGLDSSNPQGWMAAIGVLYLLNKMKKNVLMHWDGNHPVLKGIDQVETIEALLAYKAQSDLLDNLPVLRGSDKGALDFTAGRVSLIVVTKQMIELVTHESLTQALDSLWTNQDNITSLGWDPDSRKTAALLPGNKPPTSADHKGVLAGQWLAAESLPITTPVYPVRNSSFTWTTWSVFLDMSGVRAVIFSDSLDWGGVKYQSIARSNGKFNHFEPSVILERCEP
ncbi:MAG: hypothetical protein GY737_02100 [Desulfobacteraceae bacterium]|nr:hypothetical protein [Desulfobacteraceae bacterium]